MNENFLLQDIKNTLESKRKELLELNIEYEAKKEKLELLVKDYEKLIAQLEKGEVVHHVRNSSPVKKDIELPLLEAFKHAGALGMSIDQAHQFLVSNNVEASQNTVSNNIKELEASGKLIQLNAPAKRNKLYVLKKAENEAKPETIKSEVSNDEVAPGVNLQN